MSCKICHSTIIRTVVYDDYQSQYLKLFRKIFPKKPIELVYCANCYNQLVTELKSEFESQNQHEQLILLKAKIKQTYSITDNKDNRTKRYTILDENNDEFQKIQKHFNQTLQYKIIRIEKSNNPILEQKFQERSKQLTCQNIKYLFHGSNDKAYDAILETGFDVQYASPYGLLGAGIYFAEEASYSHGYGRITLTNLGQINHLLYCKVNIGNTCSGSSGLRETPKGFDGVHSEYKTYAFFDNYQGIPEYIIYYLVENR